MGTPPAGDEALMDLAIAAAWGGARRHGLPEAWPNPLVGAALHVDGQTHVAHHAAAGGPHAEAALLDALPPGRDLTGATMAVTLEPCAHTGKTPPCADALIEAGIGRVLIAVRDDSPKARGGADRLRAAGVDVVFGVAEQAARPLSERWAHVTATGMPWVVVKIAMGTGGEAVAAQGRYLTAPDIRARVHELRADVDAVVVTGATVAADDPALTVRLAGHRGPQPRPVVLDRGATSPLHAGVYERNAVVVTTESAPSAWRQALSARGNEVLVLPPEADIAATFGLLRDHELGRILVEPGPVFARMFLATDVPTELHVHHAARPGAPNGPHYDPVFYGRLSSEAADLALGGRAWHSRGRRTHSSGDTEVEYVR